MLYLIIGIVVLVGGSTALLVYKSLQESGFIKDRHKLNLQVAALTQQLRREPNNAVLITKRAVVRFRLKDLDSALTDLNHALELQPRSTEAYYHRACVFQAQRNIRAARKDFQWIHEHSEETYFKMVAEQKLIKLKR